MSFISRNSDKFVSGYHRFQMIYCLLGVVCVSACTSNPLDTLSSAQGVRPQSNIEALLEYVRNVDDDWDLYTTDTDCELSIDSHVSGLLEGIANSNELLAGETYHFSEVSLRLNTDTFVDLESSPAVFDTIERNQSGAFVLSKRNLSPEPLDSPWGRLYWSPRNPDLMWGRVHYGNWMQDGRLIGNWIRDIGSGRPYPWFNSCVDGARRDRTGTMVANAGAIAFTDDTAELDEQFRVQLDESINSDLPADPIDLLVLVSESAETWLQQRYSADPISVMQYWVDELNATIRESQDLGEFNAVPDIRLKHVEVVEGTNLENPSGNAVISEYSVDAALQSSIRSLTIERLVEQYHVDLVHVVIDVEQYTSVRGKAQIGFGKNHVPSYTLFGVTEVDNAPLATFMHEIGHNLGLRHDPDSLISQGENVDDGLPGALGYRIPKNTEFDGFSTLMAYTCVRAEHCPRQFFFSNPRRQFMNRARGESTPWLTDAVRVLQYTMPIVGRLHLAPGKYKVLLPVISR